MLITVLIGARMSEDVDEFADWTLAVMAAGFILCLVLRAVLSRLPPPPPPAAAALGLLPSPGGRENVSSGAAMEEQEGLLADDSPS